MILCRGNAIGALSRFRDFCDTVLQLWFLFLVHYTDHQFWRQQKPESSLTWIAAPSDVSNVDLFLLLLQSERIICIVLSLTLQLETSYCSENTTCNSCQSAFWEMICKRVPFHNQLSCPGVPQLLLRTWLNKNHEIQIWGKRISLLFVIEGKLSAVTYDEEVGVIALV